MFIRWILLTQIIYATAKVYNESAYNESDQGSIKQIWHSYRFDSGIGNREELHLTKVTLDENFSSANNIFMWKSMQFEEQMIIVGLSAKVLIITTYKGDNNSYTNNEELEGYPKDICMFQKWDAKTQKMLAFVVVALKVSDFEYTLKWYKMKNETLEFLWNWQIQNEVDHIDVMKVNNELKLIISSHVKNESNRSSIEIYNFSVNLYLDIWLFEKIILDGVPTLIVTFSDHDNTFLGVSLPNIEKIIVYKFSRSICLNIEDDQKHFSFHQVIQITNLQSMISFRIGLRWYLAVTSKQSSIYQMGNDLLFYPITNINLKGYHQWLVVPVDTYREDVILLSYSGSDVFLYTWKGDEKIEMISNSSFSQIACGENVDCLKKMKEISLKKSTAFFFNHHQSIIISTSNGNPLMFKLFIKLNPLQNTVTLNLNKILKSWNEIQRTYENQNKQLDEVAAVAKKISESTDDEDEDEDNELASSEIVTSPHVQSLETLSYTKNWTNIIDSIERLKDTINILNRDVKQIRDNLKYNTSYNGNFPGAFLPGNVTNGITFYGNISINELNLSTLNGYDIDKVFEDSFRKDNINKVGGTKTIENLRTENILFEKLGDTLACDLIFSDDLMEGGNKNIINGDIIWEGNLHILDDFRILPKNKIFSDGISSYQEDKQIDELFFEELEILNETYIQESVNGYPFILPVHSGDLNIHYLDIVNQAQIEQVNVHKNLDVDFINGKNFSELVQQLVFKTDPQIILDVLKIDGTLYTQDLETTQLNDFEIKKNWTVSEAETSLNDGIQKRKSEYTRARSIKRKIYVYQNLSIDGVLITDKLNNNTWKILNDTVRKGEEQINVTGAKYFKEILKTNSIKLSGTLNGRFVEHILTNSSDQIITFPQEFEKVQFENITLDGLWNKICVNCLNDSIVKMSTSNFCTGSLTFEDDCWLFSNSLNVTDSINDFSIKQNNFDKFRDTENNIVFNSIKASKVVIHGSLMSNDKINNVNLTDFNSKRVSLNNPETVDRKFFQDSMNISGSLYVTAINDNNISSIISSRGDTNHLSDFLDGKLTKIKKLLVKGNVIATEDVNGVNLTKIFEQGIRIKKPISLKGNITFENIIHFNDLNVTGSIDEVPLKKFEKDIVFKRGHVLLSGVKTFSSIKVVKDMKARTLNGHLVQDIVTLKGDESIKGSIIINGDIIVRGNVTAYGSVNNVSVPDLTKKFSSQYNSYIVEGDLNLNNAFVTIDNLIVSGKIQNKSVEELINDAVWKDDCCNITGEKTFKGEIKFKQNVWVEGTINNVNITQFFSDVVFINKPNKLKGIITIKDAVMKELEVTDYFNSSLINNYDVTDWFEDSIPLDGYVAVNGKKVFEKVQVLDDVNVDFINDHSPLSMISLKGRQYIPVVGVFPRIKSNSDLSVSGYVNGKNLKNDFEDSLLITGTHTIESKIIFNKPFTINGSLNVDTIKGKKVNNLITLDTEQNITTLLHFQGSVTVRKDVKDLKVINNIDLHEWDENSVSLNREQVLNNSWTIKGKVTAENIDGEGLLNQIRLPEISKGVRRGRKLALEMKNETEIELDAQCKEIKNISERLSQLPFMFHHFEIACELETPSVIESVITLKINNNDYALVTLVNECFSLLYKWNKINSTFEYLNQINTGLINKWLVIYKENSSYLITSSSKNKKDCEQGLKEGNVWVFEGNPSNYSHLLATDAFVDITQENSSFSSFFTLDEKGGLYQWSIDDERNITSVFLTNIGQGYHKFIDFRIMGPAVTNGKEIITIKISDGIFQENNTLFPHTNVVALPIDEQILVASIVKDKIVIYENMLEDKIFSVIHAYKVGSVLWFNFGHEKQAFLIISSHHKLIEVYEYKSVSGFVKKMSIQIFSSKLQSVALPSEKKFHLNKYLVVIQRKKILFLRADMMGDYFEERDFGC